VHRLKLIHVEILYVQVQHSSYLKQQASVSGFHDSYEAIKNLPVGRFITAIDLEDETIIASFHMKTSLIPPAQLWDFGMNVDVVPKQYSDERAFHGIHHPNSNVFIPFHLYGCISYF
jgi:hypothetical protein